MPFHLYVFYSRHPKRAFDPFSTDSYAESELRKFNQGSVYYNRFISPYTSGELKNFILKKCLTFFFFVRPDDDKRNSIHDTNQLHHRQRKTAIFFSSFLFFFSIIWRMRISPRNVYDVRLIT